MRQRRITERDRLIYSCYLANDRKIKPTVSQLRTDYPRLTAEGVRQIVAKVQNLLGQKPE